VFVIGVACIGEESDSVSDPVKEDDFASTVLAGRGCFDDEFVEFHAIPMHIHPACFSWRFRVRGNVSDLALESEHLFECAVKLH